MGVSTEGLWVAMIQKARKCCVGQGMLGQRAKSNDGLSAGSDSQAIDLLPYPMALTKTNTDDLCLPTTGYNPLILRWKKFLYRYHLWTGLYMLETHERIAFHIVVGPVVLAACLYVGVFFDGIVQGWRSSD